MMPIGVWICVNHLTDELVFIILYACSAVYFAGVMVRLMLTLTPVVCIMASIVFSKILDDYLPTARSAASETKKDTAEGSADSEDKKEEKKEEKRGSTEPSLELRPFLVLFVIAMTVLFVLHSTWVISYAYSSPSVVLASGSGSNRYIIDDFREAYQWLRYNTPEDARVMSWWDYGYQIAGMANRTTLVDNNTWNNSHIALVGKVCLCLWLFVYLHPSVCMSTWLRF
jgi:dolichyl-diphosphooligosaccharide---protein glycosyltransferase